MNVWLPLKSNGRKTNEKLISINSDLCVEFRRAASIELKVKVKVVV